MSTIAGSTVLITGGAAGIGYLMGKRLLEQGAGRLLVWDVDGEALRRVVAELTRLGFPVEGHRVDVTSLARVQCAVRELEARAVAVDLLVNNAGIVVGKEFADHSHAEIHRIMATNILGPMHLTRELLPGMLRRGRGHVVNVASAAGLLANPRMSVYCASKWAMLGWSETLRLELERSGSGVRVTTVLPSYIDTGMFAGVRSPVFPLLKADHVARAIVAAIRTDRTVLRVPRLLRLVPLLRGVLPARWFDTIAGEWLGVYDSMRTFRGRAG